MKVPKLDGRVATGEIENSLSILSSLSRRTMKITLEKIPYPYDNFEIFVIKPSGSLVMVPTKLSIRE